MVITGQNVYHAINAIRTENHQRALNPDALLVKAAQQKADDMVKWNYFAHKAPNGTTAWNIVRALKGDPLVLGENLARCYKTNEDLVEAWKRSSTHKDNIVYKDYTKTGIAIAHGKDCIYVVQLFAR